MTIISVWFSILIALNLSTAKMRRINQKTVERLTATDRRSYEKPDYETCTISDLERLIKAGNVFYHKKRQPESHTEQRSIKTKAKG